jgi:hypothetical protein
LDGLADTSLVCWARLPSPSGNFAREYQIAAKEYKFKKPLKSLNELKVKASPVRLKTLELIHPINKYPITSFLAHHNLIRQLFQGTVALD